MNYFTKSLLTFLVGLSNNNTKAWFDENRKTYEDHVKKPFSALVEELIGRIRQYEPQMEIKPSDAIMRINRDIRFSNDKTPYHSYIGANISVFGKKDKRYPSFALKISPGDVTLYGGIYMVDSALLQSIRKHIAGNLKEFQMVYKEKSFVDKFGYIQGDRNRRIPAQWQTIAEKEPLIANKQFYYSASIHPEIITSNELPDKIMEHYLAGKKVNEFLKAAYHSKDD